MFHGHIHTLHIMYTHIGAMRIVYKSTPLVEGVNTEAARVEILAQ